MTRLSIVTPNYNMAPYLHETMKSVFCNLEPGDEYFVIDGGSTDGSADLIRKYESQITGWVSERDRGYGDAIAKGFARATGDILCWINSGDLLLQGALARAKQEIAARKAELIFGDDFFIDDDDRIIQFSRGSVSNLSDVMLYGNWTPLQDATFWTRQLYERVGGIRPEVKAAADYDLFLRMSVAGTSEYVPVTFSAFRRHDGQISATKWDTYKAERERSRLQQLSELQVSWWQGQSRKLFHLNKMRVRARLGPIIWRRGDLEGKSVKDYPCGTYWPK